MNGARVLCCVLFGACILWFVGCTSAAIFADYDYSNHIHSYWDLSVKASTIQQKSIYLDKYVSALESARLGDCDALFLKTPDNCVEQNFVALRSLQGRMHDIIGMDPNSFQYQQAMQQISGQEQEEPYEVFKAAWYKKNHFLLWNWVGFLHASLIVIAGFVCALLAFSDILE